jgi:hypothetical protein
VRGHLRGLSRARKDLKPKVGNLKLYRRIGQCFHSRGIELGDDVHSGVRGREKLTTVNTVWFIPFSGIPVFEGNHACSSLLRNQTLDEAVISMYGSRAPFSASRQCHSVCERRIAGNRLNLEAPGTGCLANLAASKWTVLGAVQIIVERQRNMLG